ncbi:MAG: branched-chain amino acid ABC transporter permease [Proteobacteria bacterium]|nr:branched-chain amino acid ABC transporter permease [Pseudomonadota bacterium]
MSIRLPSLRNGVMLAGLAGFALTPVFTGVADQPYILDIAMRMMCLAIAAVSLNLILGFGGMISFGHAAFIGIGAYAVGIPAYYGEYNGFLQIPLAVGVSALFALITGAICLRTRGVYFIMITLAFGQMAFFTFVSIEEYGGDDGLVIDTRSEFAGLIDIEQPLALYYLILVCLVAALYLVKRIVASRFGRVIRGSKSNDDRMQAIGFNTFRYRLTCYVIAGALCGLAGALLGNFTGFISPDMMDWTRSGELIFMVVLGGAGSLFGPVLGTAVFLVLEELLSALTIYWQIIFGPVLILVVLFGRGGIDGLLSRLGNAQR